MSNPAVTNVDGSNPGPNTVSAPDTVQMPTGNLWKVGQFTLTLTPVSVANATTTEQTFGTTGIGLLTTDVVLIQKPATQPGLATGGSRVSAADTLAINFINVSSATITPTAGEGYKVTVLRIQPNWSAPATGNQLDW